MLRRIRLEPIPEGVEAESPDEAHNLEDEVPPTGSTLEKRKRETSDERTAGKRHRSSFETGESSQVGRLRGSGGFDLKGKKSKFVIRPFCGDPVARFAREENVTYCSSEDKVLTDEETGQRRAGYGFLFKHGQGLLTLIL